MPDINVTYAVDYAFDPETMFADKYVTAIGEEMTGPIAADPNQWYLLKSSRDGVSPAYDQGENKAVVRDHNNDVAVNDAAKDVYKYFIRLIPSESFPTSEAVNIQLGTSRYFTNESASGNTSIIARAEGATSYIAFEANQTKADQGWIGHYGFSETTDGTTKGRRLDTQNNSSSGGEANRLMYWNYNTGAGDCSVFALYPVTLGDAPTVTYDITIIGDPTGNAKVTIGGNQYGNGEQVTCNPLKGADVTVPEIANYGSNLSVAGTDVKVTYYVKNLAAINNNSLFYLNTKRGTLHYNGDIDEKLNAYEEMFVTDADKFAFVTTKEGHTYLFNVGGQKFISESEGTTTSNCPLALDIPGHPTQLNTSNNSGYPFYLTSNKCVYNLVGNNGFIRINNWGPNCSTGTQDDGNRFRLIYAGSYDLTDAVAAANAAETVNININKDAKWTTFVAPVAVDLSDLKGFNVYAYTFDGENKTKVASSEEDEVANEIPALTPVVVGINQDLAKDFTAKLIVDRGIHATLVEGADGNKLMGVLDAKTITPESGYDYYVLQNGAKGIGFYHFNPDTQTVISLYANRCFLQVDAFADAKEFIGIEDDPTAIADVDVANAKANANSYNLSGVRVDASYKGVVIVNGKKEIRK